MANILGSLWPTAIKPEIRSPISMLNEQARALVNQTSGVLQAEIRRMEDGDKIVLGFEIVVPALENYRHRILTAEHTKGLLYPIQVDAETFRSRKQKGTLDILQELLGTKPVPAIPATSSGTLAKPSSRTQDNETPPKPINRADSDEEFINLLGRVLRSPQVVSLAQSLIAQANEALEAKQLPVETDSPLSTVPATNDRVEANEITDSDAE